MAENLKSASESRISKQDPMRLSITKTGENLAEKLVTRECRCCNTVPFQDTLEFCIVGYFLCLETLTVIAGLTKPSPLILLIACFGISNDYVVSCAFTLDHEETAQPYCSIWNRNLNMFLQSIEISKGCLHCFVQYTDGFGIT